MSQAFKKPAIETAFTLIELVMVLVIIGTLAGLVVTQVGGSVERAESDSTQSVMRTVHEAIDGYINDNGDILMPNPVMKELARQNAPQLRYLFINPDTETPEPTYDPHMAMGWRGPYIKTNLNQIYLTDAEAASRDAAERSGFTGEYGLNDDPSVLDGWANPLVIHYEDVTYVSGGPVWRVHYLTSAGPDGALETSPNIGDDIRVEVHRERLP